MTLYNPQDDNPILETDRVEMHPVNAARVTLDPAMGAPPYNTRSGWTWKTIFEYLQTNLWQPITWNNQGLAMHWHATWVGRVYSAGSVVQDDGFLMIANKETSQKAAPVLTGAADFIAPDVPTWAAQFPVTEQVAVGHRYTFSSAQFITKWRVWIPALAATIQYQFVARDVTDPANPVDVINTLINPLTADAWHTVNLAGSTAFVGDVLELYLITSDTTATSDFTGSWQYNAGTSATVPDVGDIFYRTSTNNLRINDLDNDAVDQSASLDTVVPGTIFEFANGATKQVEAVLAGGVGYHEYLVTTISEPLAIVQTVTVKVPVAAATEYSEVVNHWATNQPAFATVVSLLDEASAARVEGDELYGVDIEVDAVTASEDWDIMALS